MFKDERANSTETTDSPTSLSQASRIGSQLALNGRISGRDDLLIEGRFKGHIELNQGSLVIARGAKVEADIRVKFLTLQGELKGNVDADERILVAETATLTGDITAARVSIMNGARFKGAIRIKNSVST
jgi:cytoskeletal protein CcmA (bactofilin family)